MQPEINSPSNDTAAGTVTVLLLQLQTSAPECDEPESKAALDHLWRIIYKDVYDSARNYLRKRKPIADLGATALVSEAFLKLMAKPDLAPRSRNHLLALVTLAMTWAEKSLREKEDKLGNPFSRQPAPIDVESPTGIGSAGDHERLQTPDDLPERLVLTMQVLDRLEALEPVQLQVLQMKFLEGWSEREIAARINRTDRTVRNHVRNALTFLRTCLDDRAWDMASAPGSRRRGYDHAAASGFTRPPR